MVTHKYWKSTHKPAWWKPEYDRGELADDYVGTACGYVVYRKRTLKRWSRVTCKRCLRTRKSKVKK